MNWIGPLFTNAGGWEAYVTYAEGKWYIGKDEIVEVGTGKSGIMLLPILQKSYGEDYSTQISLLKKGLLQYDESQEIAYTFPFLVPVLTAYTAMPNWAEHAIAWLPHLNLDREAGQKIFDACHAGNFEQKVRQKTISHITKWSKERGFQYVRQRC